MGGGSGGGGTHVYLWLIHVDIWQKLSQYCKVIILQLKYINKLKKKKDVQPLSWAPGSCLIFPFGCLARKPKTTEPELLPSTSNPVPIKERWHHYIPM